MTDPDLSDNALKWHEYVINILAIKKSKHESISVYKIMDFKISDVTCDNEIISCKLSEVLSLTKFTFSSAWMKVYHTVQLIDDLERFSML